jgi:hypothetical protein
MELKVFEEDVASTSLPILNYSFDSNSIGATCRYDHFTFAVEGSSDPFVDPTINGAITENSSILWMSGADTATATAGNVYLKSKNSGVEKLIQITDFNNGTLAVNIPSVDTTDLLKSNGSDSFTAGTLTLDAGTNLEIDGSISISSGASNGLVLTSNASGLATWQAAPSGADDLGNHTATDNLDLATHHIFNAGNVNGVTGNFITVNATDFIGGTFNGTFVGDGSGLNGLGSALSNGSLNNTSLSNGYLQDPTINGTAFFTDNSITQFNGQIIIPAGSSNGYVLTSDANGLASWQLAASGSGGNGVSAGASGAIQFSDGSNNFLADSSNLHWDNAFNRLGIGNNSPAAALQVNGSALIGYPNLSTIALGVNTAFSNTGSNVNAFGDGAAQQNKSDYVNALGQNTAYLNNGDYVNAFGPSSAFSNIGSRVTAIGSQAAYSNNGDYVFAIGTSAASYNTGNNLNAFGNSAGFYNNADELNAFGINAGYHNNGEATVALGSNAAYYNRGDDLNAIGNSAGHSNNGEFVNAIGSNTAYNNIGDHVDAMGLNAALNNNGSSLVAIGSDAASNNNGSFTIAIGSSSAFANRGNNAIAVGRNTLYTANGDYNIAIGDSAGSDLSNGSENILIGRSVQANDNNGNFQLNIGDTIFGDLANGEIALGIAKTNPDATLELNGSFLYRDGNETNGYVLTSDANGIASWQAAAGASSGGSVAGSVAQVQFNNGNDFDADANFNWDNTNKRLGLGNSNPAARLQVNGWALIGYPNLNTIAIGNNAAALNNGTYVTALGTNAANLNNGNNLQAIGRQAAMYSNGDDVVAIGYRAAALNHGDHLVAIGDTAARDNQGDDVIAIGNIAAMFNSGSDVIGLGGSAANSNNGNFVYAIGNYAAQSNNGDYVYAFGNFAAQANRGDYVSSIGSYSTQENEGDNISALGAFSAENNLGADVVAIGRAAAQDNSGNEVSAIGHGAAENNSGNQVIAIGDDAAELNNGNYAIAIGRRTLNHNNGDYNIAIGDRAGLNLSNGSENILIGRNVNAVDNNADYQLNIGDTIFGNLSTGEIALGIAKANPDATLELNGSFLYRDGNESTGYVLTSDANGIASWQSSGVAPAGNNGQIQFYNGGSLAATQYFRFKETQRAFSSGFLSVANGNSSVALGLGCTATGNTSFCAGETNQASGASSVAIGEDNVAAHNLTVAIGWGNDALSSTSHAYGSHNYSNGSGAMAFGYSNISNGTRSIAIGENTEASGNNSHVIGSSAGGFGDYLTNEINDSLIIGYNSNAPTFFVGPSSGGTTTGNVGIATTNPSAKLDVNGEITATSIGVGRLTTIYPFEVEGNAGKTTGGGSWSVASDARLKDIQGKYEYGLKEIMKLNTIRFNYKEGNALDLPSNTNEIGFIAQEVKEVIPDAVNIQESGYYDLNVHPINIALVNAIQELKAENDILKEYLCKKDPEAIFCK